MSNKCLENKIRKHLANNGLALRKSRQGVHANNMGGYMVIDIHDNSVVIGSSYEYSLEEISTLIHEGRL